MRSKKKIILQDGPCKGQVIEAWEWANTITIKNGNVTYWYDGEGCSVRTSIAKNSKIDLKPEK